MKKGIFGLAAIAAIVATYLYVNQPHRSVRQEEGIFITADSLFHSFEQNEAAANALYLNKILLVRGKIKSIEHNAEGGMVIVLDTGDSMFGINCTLDGTFDVEEGKEVTVKGVCTGYLADVVINQAIIELSK